MGTENAIQVMPMNRIEAPRCLNQRLHNTSNAPMLK